MLIDQILHCYLHMFHQNTQSACHQQMKCLEEFIICLHEKQVLHVINKKAKKVLHGSEWHNRVQ